MTDVETLRQLLARVEGAAGADREIDGDLVLAFGGFPDDAFPFVRDVAWTYRGHAEWVTPSPRSLGLDVVWRAPSYTASVDAALALTERVAPRCSIAFRQQSGKWIANLWKSERFHEVVIHSTPALALLAALLRAKIAETDNG